MTKKVAFITGAAQGIGEAIARRLADDGFAVAIADLNEEGAKKLADQLNAQGKTAIGIALDVSDPQAMDAAVDKVAEQFGDFNVMVNNAGLAPSTPIGTITEEQFETVTRVNVGGTMWGVQSATRKFRELKHGGKIINATSQTGVVGNPRVAVYASTKFAVRGITQVAARELASEGITVNAYAPGIVKTPMMQNLATALAKKNDVSEEEAMAAYTSNIALGRLSEPEDVAAAVSFLAGPDSDYVTGHTLEVDGGMQFH